MKKTFALVLAIVLILSCLTLVSCKGDTDENVYEVWMSASEDPTLYSEYNDNPCIRYLNSMQFKGKDGELVDVELKFYAPPTGEAPKAFNNMIATGEYYDVMDLAQGDYSALELFEEGVLIDLTPYLENGAMPNYMKWQSENPDYAKTATTLVNGVPKYLQIYAYNNTFDAWGGWQYRRDWIANYGTNPSTGAGFSGSLVNGTWVDDVMFPSWYNESLRTAYLKYDPNWTGTDPVFISDWEWMLDIFKDAIADYRLAGKMATTDGYPMGIYYPGYIEVGDLMSGFGGGNAVWYKDGDDVLFGGTSENFRAYLQCMQAWYQNGWLDEKFDERTGDIFYQVDIKNVYGGNVGLWYGNQSSTLNKLEKSEAKATAGIYVMAARQPINDIYGSGEANGQKFVPDVNEFIPDTMYQAVKETNSIGLTNKMNEKDIYAFLSCVDYIYGEEGYKLNAMGLTKEQYETIAQESDVYKMFGIDDTGSYYKLDTPVNGKEYRYADEIIADTSKAQPSKINRFVGLGDNTYLDKGDSVDYLRIQNEWLFYKSKGQFLNSFYDQLTSEDSKTYNSVLSKIRNYSNVEIPKFIKGENSLTNDWGNFGKTINRYGVSGITQKFQELWNRFK